MDIFIFFFYNLSQQQICDDDDDYDYALYMLYLVFSVCLGKKNVEANEFLGILKKYVSKNKI